MSFRRPAGQSAEKHIRQLFQLILGAKVNDKYVYSYKPMYGGRWTTYLSKMNDRFLKVIDDNPEFITENNVDVDILRKMFNEIGKK